MGNKSNLTAKMKNRYEMNKELSKILNIGRDHIGVEQFKLRTKSRSDLNMSRSPNVSRDNSRDIENRKKDPTHLINTFMLEIYSNNDLTNNHFYNSYFTFNGEVENKAFHKQRIGYINNLVQPSHYEDYVESIKSSPLRKSLSCVRSIEEESSVQSSIQTEERKPSYGNISSYEPKIRESSPEKEGPIISKNQHRAVNVIDVMLNENGRQQRKNNYHYNQTDRTMSNLNISSATKSKSRSKTRKVYKNPPVVNIKINIKDFIKEDVYENAYNSTSNRFVDKKKFSKDPLNITNITKINQSNINDGSFVDMVDLFSQTDRTYSEVLKNRKKSKSPVSSSSKVMSLQSNRILTESVFMTPKNSTNSKIANIPQKMANY